MYRLANLALVLLFVGPAAALTLEVTSGAIVTSEPALQPHVVLAGNGWSLKGVQRAILSRRFRAHVQRRPAHLAS
jgi:hypothetical protein